MENPVLLTEITKVKVKNEKAELEYSQVSMDYSEDPDGKRIPDSYTKKGGRLVHPDFTAALNKLRIHLALLGELIPDTFKEKDFDDEKEGNAYIDERLNSIRVNGITVNHDAKTYGACIQGVKTLKSGKVLVLNGPFIQFDRDDLYSHCDIFQEDIELVLQEAASYLDGSKTKKPNQLDLGFEGSDKDEEVPDKGSDEEVTESDQDGKVVSMGAEVEEKEEETVTG